MVLAVGLGLGLSLHQVVEDKELDIRLCRRRLLLPRLRGNVAAVLVVVFAQELLQVLHVVTGGQPEALVVDVVEQFLGQGIQDVVQTVLWGRRGYEWGNSMPWKVHFPYVLLTVIGLLLLAAFVLKEPRKEVHGLPQGDSRGCFGSRCGNWSGSCRRTGGGCWLLCSPSGDELRFFGRRRHCRFLGGRSSRCRYWFPHWFLGRSVHRVMGYLSVQLHLVLRWNRGE